jgi:D-tyrosyl-tRNA(Tyr) deacylase
MRAVVQRVRAARVEVDAQTIGQIGPGLLIFLGVTHTDTQADLTWLAGKIARLRIFADEQGKMNRSVSDAGGSILAVPQFTLYGDVSRGNRPGFEQAARPELARPLFAAFCADLAARGIPLATGCFGADMQVSLTNDGPVTFILDSALRLSETQRANRARTPGVREGKGEAE